VHAISYFLSEADEMQYIGTPRVFPQVNLFFHLGKGGLYVYRNTYVISRDSKMCTFEVLLFCQFVYDVWTTDLGILSGKPYNTVSMARLKTLHFHLTLTPPRLSPSELVFSLGERREEFRMMCIVH
jgi:hypothetical protein